MQDGGNSSWQTKIKNPMTSEMKAIFTFCFHAFPPAICLLFSLYPLCPLSPLWPPPPFHTLSPSAVPSKALCPLSSPLSPLPPLSPLFLFAFSPLYPLRKPQWPDSSQSVFDYGVWAGGGGRVGTWLTSPKWFPIHKTHVWLGSYFYFNK